MSVAASGLPHAAVDRIEALADDNLPAGIGLHFINEAATLKDTSNELAIVRDCHTGRAVGLVRAVRVAGALVIVLTVPFGLAAAVFSLKVTGTSINIYSQIGLVMLVGLMAKNGILVVEFADQLRDRGKSVIDAVSGAATTACGLS